MLPLCSLNVKSKYSLGRCKPSSRFSFNWAYFYKILSICNLVAFPNSLFRNKYLIYELFEILMLYRVSKPTSTLKFQVKILTRGFKTSLEIVWLPQLLHFILFAYFYLHRLRRRCRNYWQKMLSRIVSETQLCWPLNPILYTSKFPSRKMWLNFFFVYTDDKENVARNVDNISFPSIAGES